ncbi:hypothetical protein EOW65_15970 [Sinirhodobacter ferrireducens]|uniref:Uncharacterized protein n=1 Tax=Paenirhodobacter ferrireducens TaxID=1215032 RepID=A0A443L9A2_9RHOB|nr:DUF6324 family protein [Sinirhodobacter ferrireducens]RWR45734.1 hypothetical protein EOW65_15970 [Sinirhodobacter ferrireducens]
MSINKQSDIAGDLQIGPTDHGMVRIYIVGEDFEFPFDFDPEEAEDIAEELMAAAEQARAIAEDQGGKSAKGQKPKGKK